MGKYSQVLPLTVLIGALLAVGPASGIAIASGRQPVPSAAQLTRAEAMIKELFREDYAHRTPADRQALARKLLAQALDTSNDAFSRYVCYREARDLATLGGDLPTAFTAVNSIAKDFVVDPKDVQKMKVATYIAVAKSVDTTEANAALAEVGLNLLSHLVALESYDDADRLLVPIEAAAKKTKEFPLLRRVLSSRDEVTDRRREAQKASLAAETLKKTPGDPEASLTLGRHLAFVKGSWDDGLPLLAKSSDATLKALAQKELAKPADSKLQLQIADGWWSQAETQTGAARTNIQKHAQEQYQGMYASLAGADAARVASRLPAGMLPQPAPAPAAGATAPPAPAPAATRASPLPAATQPAGAADEVTRFWWTTTLRPPGLRTWRKTAADMWEEVDPQGSVKQFRVVSHDDPQLGSGTVVRNVADAPLEVWVPKLVDGNMIYFRRSDRDNQWHVMSGIHIGDPPAPIRP